MHVQSKLLKCTYLTRSRSSVTRTSVRQDWWSYARIIIIIIIIIIITIIITIIIIIIIIIITIIIIIIIITIIITIIISYIHKTSRG